MSRTPRLFPGYTVAAVATLALFATAPGQTILVSQLNTEPIRESLGISKYAFNTTYTVATILAGLPLVFTGVLTDRLGPRRMMAIVAVCFAGGCLVMSQAQGLVTLFLGFFCLRFLGQGSLSLVASHSVAMWFHRRLGSVNGLKTVVLFGLWAYLPKATLELIGTVGWRQTYMIFAIAIVALIVPTALLFVRDAPEDLGLRTDNDPPESAGGDQGDARAPVQPEPSFTLREALRTRAYWILALSTVLPGFVGTAMLFDLIPIVNEQGAGADQAAGIAAFAVGAWSATMAVMAIPAGVVTDRIHPKLVISVSMTIGAAATAIVTVASSAAETVAGMVLYGFAMSFSSASAAATTARYFGRLHHGSIRSSLTRLGVIGTGLGPLATALSEAWTGSYRPALWFFTVLTVLAAAAASTLAKPGPLRARDG